MKATTKDTAGVNQRHNALLACSTASPRQWHETAVETQQHNTLLGPPSGTKQCLTEAQPGQSRSFRGLARNTPRDCQFSTQHPRLCLLLFLLLLTGTCLHVGVDNLDAFAQHQCVLHHTPCCSAACSMACPAAQNKQACCIRTAAQPPPAGAIARRHTDCGLLMMLHLACQALCLTSLTLL